jgi:hypothetical protein
MTLEQIMHDFIQDEAEYYKALYEETKEENYRIKGDITSILESWEVSKA